MELDVVSVQICADDRTMLELTLTMARKDGEALLHAISAAGVDVNVDNFSGETLIMLATVYATVCGHKERRNVVAGIALAPIQTSPMTAA